MNQLKRARWMLGIVAFGLFVSGVTVWPAIGVIFVLIRWAVGLTRVKLLVFEDVQAPKNDHDHNT